MNIGIPRKISSLTTTEFTPSQRGRIEESRFLTDDNQQLQNNNYQTILSSDDETNEFITENETRTGVSGEAPNYVMENEIPRKVPSLTTTEFTSSQKDINEDSMLLTDDNHQLENNNEQTIITQIISLDDESNERISEDAPKNIMDIKIPSKIPSLTTIEFTPSQRVRIEESRLLTDDNQQLEHNNKQTIISSDLVSDNETNERSIGTVVSKETPEQVMEISYLSTTTAHTPRPNPSRKEKIFTPRLLTFESQQLKLTDFYDLYKVIKNNISGVAELHNQFSATVAIVKESSTEISSCNNWGVSNLLEFLKDAALRNAKKDTKLKCGNRYSNEYKQFCLYIYLTGGRLAYETLAANTSNALPSLATLSRTLSLFGKCLEGSIEFSKLQEFLQKRNYPKYVFISEDQTAIVGRVRYNASANELTGLVPKISKETGFPLSNQYGVNSVMDIKHGIENNSVANNAYVYMAQPLVDGAPAFCLTIFGSDNKFSSDNVTTRWKYLVEQAIKHDITVVGFSSDGDTRCLKAMKRMAGLPLPNLEVPYSPYFQAHFSLDKPVVIQDTVHISTKLKTRLLKPNLHMPMGKYVVSKDHLQTLITNFPKDKHLLCPSYLDGSDKMNFNSINKMCAPLVTDLLAGKEEFKATRRFLIVTRAIPDSFLDKALTIERRVYLIWYATFFMHLWRTWIKEHELYTLGNNWITLNAYTCVELNAHGILILFEKFRLNQTPELMVPWLFSSQPCKKFFRQTRSMTSTYATKVNFDLLDLLQRKHRIQSINNIVHDSEKFAFPREKNKKLGVNTPNLTLIPSTGDLKMAIENAKHDAKTDAHELEIILPPDLEELALTLVSLPQVDNLLDTCEDNILSHEQMHQSTDINTEDLNDIEKEKEVFSDLEEINIKDYTNTCGKADGIDDSYLKILVNNKELLVKKTTLCWFFSNQKGRLSSDRILRVRGMTQTKSGKKQRNTSKKTLLNKKNGQKTKAKSKKITSVDETTSESSSDYHTESEFEVESFSDGDPEEVQLGIQKKEVQINLEHYYAVMYDMWYIGRVVEILDMNSCKIKFLKSELDSYIWPRDNDTQVVNNKFIFYGPVELIGSGPFKLKRCQKLDIEKNFKEMKKIIINKTLF